MHDAVVHDGIKRVERGGLDEELVTVAIAEGQPLLAVVALAGPADVGAMHAPGGVDVVEPEWRGPRADGDVDEDLGVLDPQALGDVEQGHEVRADAIAGAVPFEGVHAAFAHEFEAAVREPLAVLRIREVELRAFRDEAELLGVGGAFLVAAVAAERRDPDAEFRAEWLHLRLGAGEAQGEALRVFDPQALAGVVPAIVDEVREHGHATLLHELGVEGPDDVEHLGLVDTEAEVVPAVVMQERLGLAGAFAFDVAQEGAAELATGDADDGAEGVGLGRVEFERASEGDACARGSCSVRRAGHLHAREEAGARHGATRGRPDGGEVG